MVAKQYMGIHLVIPLGCVCVCMSSVESDRNREQS